ANQRLPWIPLRLTGAHSEGRRIHGNAAPAQWRKAIPPQQTVNPRLERRNVRAFAERERKHPNPKLILVRQVLAGADKPFKEAAFSREQEPRSIARLVDGPSAVLDATEARQCKVNQLSGRASRVGDRPDSTAASPRVKLQPIGDPPRFSFEPCHPSHRRA